MMMKTAYKYASLYMEVNKRNSSLLLPFVVGSLYSVCCCVWM